MVSNTVSNMSNHVTHLMSAFKNSINLIILNAISTSHGMELARMSKDGDCKGDFLENGA